MGKKKKEFLSEFLRNRSQVGSVTPSSRFLVKKMLSVIDYDKDKVIVEFGPGEGVLTKALAQEMPGDARVFTFELNPMLFNILKKETAHDKRIFPINDSAEKVKEYLAKAGFEKADVIVSSLPLTPMPKAVSQSIVNNAREVLKPGGYYVQYQYSLGLRGYFREVFDEVSTDFTLLNVPPAFIFRCRKN